MSLIFSSEESSEDRDYARRSPKKGSSRNSQNKRVYGTPKISVHSPPQDNDSSSDENDDDKKNHRQQFPDDSQEKSEMKTSQEYNYDYSIKTLIEIKDVMNKYFDDDEYPFYILPYEAADNIENAQFKKLSYKRINKYRANKERRCQILLQMKTIFDQWANHEIMEFYVILQTVLIRFGFVTFATPKKDLFIHRPIVSICHDKYHEFSDILNKMKVIDKKDDYIKTDHKLIVTGYPAAQKVLLAICKYVAIHQENLTIFSSEKFKNASTLNCHVEKIGDDIHVRGFQSIASINKNFQYARLAAYKPNLEEFEYSDLLGDQEIENFSCFDYHQYPQQNVIKDDGV